MMRYPRVLLFDANPLVNGKKSGVGYYTQSLIQALASTYPEEIKLVGHYFSFLGRKDNIRLPEAPNIEYVRSKIIPGRALSILRRLGLQLPLELFFKRRGDFALFTNFVSLPSFTGIPTAVVVHDLCFLEVPEYVSERNRNFLKRFVPQSLKRARKVIIISAFTKAAVQNHYSVPEDRFIITPIAPAPKIEAPDINIRSLGITKKYLLFVGTLEPRKNILSLAEAYELLPADIRAKYQLVLAGAPGWYIEETLGYINKLQNSGFGILTLGHVSDKQRAALYEHAELFVLPSHYEGFGMPILEAMSYGVPTAVSNLPVFHEVAGAASYYFNQNDPQDIAASIEKLLRNAHSRQELAKAGHDRLRLYNWKVTAQGLYKDLFTS